MSNYTLTLSTTEPNNLVGLLKFRQGDKDSQVLNVTVTENGKLFKFDGLAVFFNSVLPNGTVVRDKVQTIDYANSKLTYKVIDSFLQEVATISAWFSFESGDKTVDSTKNFRYIVEAGWQSCITQGNYIYELSEIQREIEEIISNKDFTSLISKIDDLENDITAQLEQINQQKIDKNGHYDNAESKPFFEASTIGSGSVFHLLGGEGATAPYIVGVGVDHGTITGLLTSVKDSGVGLATTLETTSTENAKGFFAQVFGSGKLIDLVQATGTGYPMVTIRNPWGGQRDLLKMETNAWKYRVSPTGVLESWNGGTDEHPQCFVAEKIGAGGTYEKFILSSANLTQYFATRISASSNYFTIQQCLGTGLDYSNFTWNTILKVRDGNAIGFYGVEPVTRKQITEVTTENIFSALKNLGLVAQ